MADCMNELGIFCDEEAERSGEAAGRSQAGKKVFMLADK